MNPEARKERLREQVQAYNVQVKNGQKDQSYLKTLRGSALSLAGNEGIDLQENKDGTLSEDF